jgi:hypothetical protein
MNGVINIVDTNMATENTLKIRASGGKSQMKVHTPMVYDYLCKHDNDYMKPLSRRDKHRIEVKERIGR